MNNKNNRVWYLLLGTIFLLGLYTFGRFIFMGHDAVFHSDDNVPWTLMLASYIFFILLSTGLTLIASLYTVFNIQRYRVIAKRAIFLAIASLIAGLLSEVAELGSPLNLYNYFLTPNFTSPIWWMGIFYSLYFLLLITKFLGLHFGDWESKTARVISIVTFILVIAALTTLGSVFGVIEARPTFFGEFIMAYFLLTAILSGIAALLFFTLVRYKVTTGKLPEEQRPLFRELARIFGGVLGLTILFLIWRTLIGWYALRPDFEVVKYLTTSIPFFFEFVVGLIIPFVMMLFKKYRSTYRGLITATVLVFLGLMVGRMDILMIGQMQPLVPKFVGEIEFTTYFPTIWEWMITLFVLDLMVIIYLFGEMKLNLSDS